MRWLSDALLHMGALALAAIRSGRDRTSSLQAASDFCAKVAGPSPLASIGPAFGLAWAEHGFPIVEPSHMLAASLMATTMPNEIVDELRMPWRCYGFRVPAGLISDAGVFSLVIASHNGLYQMISERGTMEMHYGIEASLSSWNLKIIKHSIGSETIDESHPDFERAEASGRTTELLGRLFVGICAEMNAHSMRDGGRAGGQPTRHRRSGEPRTFTYKLTRPVRVDVRAAVGAYARGIRRSSPSVQVLVRGHWKMQRTGERGADRKLIHVEPYWRGPEDAPIAIRSHVIARGSTR